MCLPLKDDINIRVRANYNYVASELNIQMRNNHIEE